MTARPHAARLAYAHLNLTRNPFGEADAATRAGLVVADLDELVAHLGRPGAAVQIVGDCGRGKTSHLLALGARLPMGSYVRIDPERHPAVPRAPVVLVDEVQWLSPRRRARLFRRRATSFALGTHVDLTAELERAGLTVRTLWPGRSLQPERLQAIFARRIEWARRGPGPVPTVPRATVRTLTQRFGDDVRAMEGALYAAVQGAEEIGDVQV